MEIGLIGLDEIGNKKKRQERREERKEKREDRKEKRQEKRQDKKEDKKKKKEERKNKREEKKQKRGGSRAKKFFLAPARAAFFLLMKINFLKLRTKLREGYKKDKGKIESGIIKKFGFKRENFMRELNRKEDEKLSGLGVAAEAAVAQSTPILVQVAQILSQLGIAAGALSSASKALKGKDKEMADEFTQGVEENINDIPESEREQGGGQTADDFKDKPEIKEEGGSGSGLMSGKLPLILGIGAAALLGLYFFTKKK